MAGHQELSATILSDGSAMLTGSIGCCVQRQLRRQRGREFLKPCMVQPRTSPASIGPPPGPWHSQPPHVAARRMKQGRNPRPLEAVDGRVGAGPSHRRSWAARRGRRGLFSDGWSWLLAASNGETCETQDPPSALANVPSVTRIVGCHRFYRRGPSMSNALRAHLRSRSNRMPAVRWKVTANHRFERLPMKAGRWQGPEGRGIFSHFGLGGQRLPNKEAERVVSAAYGKNRQSAKKRYYLHSARKRRGTTDRSWHSLRSRSVHPLGARSPQHRLCVLTKACTVGGRARAMTLAALVRLDRVVADPQIWEWIQKTAVTTPDAWAIRRAIRSITILRADCPDLHQLHSVPNFSRTISKLFQRVPQPVGHLQTRSSAATSLPGESFVIHSLRKGSPRGEWGIDFFLSCCADPRLLHVEARPSNCGSMAAKWASRMEDHPDAINRRNLIFKTKIQPRLRRFRLGAHYVQHWEAADFSFPPQPFQVPISGRSPLRSFVIRGAGATGKNGFPCRLGIQDQQWF